jgi:O-antigen chain-terminating methyltransferase
VGGDRPADDDRRAPAPDLESFVGEPTRSLDDWRWLWEGDRRFPVRSHRGFLGRLLVAFKRLAHPFVKAPLADLWDRQRTFNLILVERLAELEQHHLGSRVSHLERALPDQVNDALVHNDALYARLDQKLDRYRREAEELRRTLGAALAALPAGAGPEAAGGPPSGEAAALAAAAGEQGYVELERRFRGTEAEIGERLAVYLPRLRGHGPVLDLGCGRGELLALLAGEGIAAHGVDGSAAMVEQCRERGLRAEQRDLFDALAAAPPGELGAVVSFHVVEHLPPESIDRLVRLAWRALGPGGLLIVETPNPLSLVVAARNFWLDPTHRRPVHPESLRLSFELAGFDPVERLDLRPFPAAERLPEVDLAALPGDQRELADRVNRLRDRLDDLLFGFQDYALVGTRGSGPYGTTE